MLAWQIRVDELLDSRVELPCDHLCQRHPGAYMKPQIERKTNQREMFILKNSNGFTKEDQNRFQTGERGLRAQVKSKGGFKSKRLQVGAVCYTA